MTNTKIIVIITLILLTLISISLSIYFLFFKEEKNIISPVQPVEQPIIPPVQQPIQQPVQQPIQPPVEPSVQPVQQPVEQSIIPPVEQPVQPIIPPVEQPEYCPENILDNYILDYNPILGSQIQPTPIISKYIRLKNKISFNFLEYNNEHSKESFTLPSGILTDLSNLNPNIKYIVGNLIPGKTPSKTQSQFGGLDCTLGSFPSKIYIPQA